MENVILIFPAGMPRAIDFLEKCLREKRIVIGASSLAHDPSRQHYPAWLHLPYVIHESFDAALTLAIRENNIKSIYSPNPVVWDHLSRNLDRIAPGVCLINSSPANTELEGFRSAQLRARELLAKSLPLASANKMKPNLTELAVTSMLTHSELIPGMCDHEKVRALYEVARNCLAGDVVEIGSWWGKSAFVLLQLAQNFEIGKVLCVDPWSDEHLVQNDASELVNSVSAQVSADEAFNVFLVNLLPYSAGGMNYLRMPSTNAVVQYQAQREIKSFAFGSTTYCGQIALLHIDGNHSYDNAKADIDAWSGLVKDGGWIVIDDYSWPFGDGPRKAADQFIHENQAFISTSFFMGGAMFIQKM